MAKKGKTGYLGMFAFVAILINAIAWLFKILHDQWDVSISIRGSQLYNLLLGIGSLILVLVAMVAAHDFAEKQSTFWRVLYWVLAISSIVAIIFGVGVNFFN